MSESVKAESRTDSYDRMIPIEYYHAKIHNGEMFRINGDFTLASGAYQYMLFKTGSKTVHIYGEVVSSDLGSFKFYESPTITADGTPLVPLNKNRNSTNTPLSTVYASPTVTANGTLLDSFLLSTTKNAGGKDSNENEWNLKPNTDYLFAIYSGANNNDFITKADWYEL
jgi:hypothetical protein